MRTRSLYLASALKVWHLFLWDFYNHRLWHLFHLSSRLLKHAFPSVDKPLAFVVPFIGCIDASSFVITKSFIIPRMKMSNWVVSWKSQLSSRAMGRNSKSAFFCSWSFKFSAISSILHVTVRLESATFSNDFFFLRHCNAATVQSPPNTLWWTPH